MTSWRDAAYLIIGLLIGVVLHEYMHGRIADWRGDHTARNAGRLTLNPIPHIDPFGTILLPLGLLVLTGGAMVFGYAKPVPVNPYFLKKKHDMVLVALGGPVTNFTIAAVFTGIGAILNAVGIHAIEVYRLLFAIVEINIVLGVFNLLPIPPLDGSHVLEYFLSDSARDTYERLAPFGFIIILVIVWGTNGAFFRLLNPLFRWVAAAMGLTLSAV